MRPSFGCLFCHLDDPTSHILKIVKPCSLGEKCLKHWTYPNLSGWPSQKWVKKYILFRIQIQWSLHHRFVYFWIDNTGVVILNWSSLKLTVCTWRWMVGRWVSVASGRVVVLWDHEFQKWIPKAWPFSFLETRSWFFCVSSCSWKNGKNYMFWFHFGWGSPCSSWTGPKKEQQAHKAPCSLMNAFFSHWSREFAYRSWFGYS